MWEQKFYKQEVVEERWYQEAPSPMRRSRNDNLLAYI